jgi:NDP-sugar pyrophosphorylase family protein
MKAFILAGGFGTRLRSVVNDRPKPLAPIQNAPFLEHQLRYLRANGVHEFVFCVGYRHEQIQEYFGDGRKWDVSIAYSVEGQPLGTAGALKNAERFVDGTFLVVNGDTYFDLSIRSLLNAHDQFRGRDVRCLGTLALTRVDDPSEFGSVHLNSKGAVVEFREKSATRLAVHYINAGIYLLEPRILDLIPFSQKVSLEREVFPRVRDSGQLLYGHCADGFFCDIGTPEGYHRFQEHVGEIAP